MMRGGAKARPGAIYHVISRFVGKAWFIQSGVERRAYLSALGFELRYTDWRCFAYAVMSSHIHLGVLAGKRKMKHWLGPAHEAFARWINGRLERPGAVLVRGPDLVEFRPEGVRHLINYIHCNPVRAGVVGHPSESDWTSHRAYLGKSHPQPWLDIELGLLLAGFEDGHALGEWMDKVRVERAELDTFRVTPRARRGRPPNANRPKPAENANMPKAAETKKLAG